jgi:hypothetical protein
VPVELSIVALLLAAAAVAGVSARYGYSSPLVLTAVGIGLSFVPGVPSYPLTPELALTGFLPPLLYAAAIRTPFVDMRRNVRPILSLSIGLVLVTRSRGSPSGCCPTSPCPPPSRSARSWRRPTRWPRPLSRVASGCPAASSRSSRARACSTTPPPW